MPQVIEHPIVSSAQVANVAADWDGFVPFAGRKKWTRAECDNLEQYGFLKERYELLDGEIIIKMGQGILHGIGVMRAIFWLAGVFGQENIQSQITTEVSPGDQEINSPEPDVIVLSRPATTFSQTPSGTDLLLALEVSYSTQQNDLRTKALLYARAGVPEYWVLDIFARRLVVHRQPTENGYTEIFPVVQDGQVAPVSAPERFVTVNELLPPASQQ